MVGNILAVGLMSLGMGLSGVKDEPQMYAEDQTTYTITYNKEDWENKAQSIYDWLVANEYSNTPTASRLSITGSTLNTSTNIEKIAYNINNEGTINLWDSNDYQYNYNIENKTLYNSYNSQWITIEEIKIVSQTFYEGNAEPKPMGEGIIEAIVSGLGIIGSLATGFLSGFSTLFWSEGALTTFGIFALVMLGVAVSFAVVKLVLNLIRSNTGA